MANENREIADLIVSSRCYQDTIGATDKAKVASEAACTRRPLPRSLLAQAAARNYRLACTTEQPDTPPAVRSRSLFDAGRYAYVRDPRSGSETEKLDALKATGVYAGVALNTGDHPPADWDGWRQLAAARGLYAIPWARTLTLTQLATLAQLTLDWNAPAVIANLEQDDTPTRWQFTGQQAAAPLGALPPSIAIGLSTEPWLPENLDWGPLIQIGAVCLPQTATLEFPALTPQVACDRAKQFGFTNPWPSFATYDVPQGTPERSDYPWNQNHGIYTLDDITAQEVTQWV